MSLLFALLALFGAEQVVPTLPPTVNSSRHANVVLKVYADAGLRQAHAGYWVALQARPEWLEREAVWWELMRTPDLGPLLARVDELLQKHPESQALYDQFYTTLSRDAGLRNSFEQFERAALEPRGDDNAWLRALEYVRANPAGALPFLGGITPEATLPEALQPYALQLMRGADWNNLRAPLSGLMESDDARAALMPWWREAAALDAQHDGLFSKLGLELLRNPNRFWAVYRRELALAEDPALRDWVRWLHRRMRRESTGHADYLAYLSAIRSGQEKVPMAPAKAWPPEGAPPVLGSIAENRLPALKADTVATPQEPKLTMPKRPDVKRPARLGAPEMRQSERLKAREPGTPLDAGAE